MEVETQEPTNPAIRDTLESMRKQGIKCLYGRWLVEGAPQVILFDTGSAYSRLDEWKGDLWNLAGIPTPPNDHETNETIVFGYLVAWFLGEVCATSLLFTSPPESFQPYLIRYMLIYLLIKIIHSSSLTN